MWVLWLLILILVSTVINALTEDYRMEQIRKTAERRKRAKTETSRAAFDNNATVEDTDENKDQ